MRNNQRVFLAGASGETGKRVLHNLIDDNLVREIHLLVRNPVSLVNPRVYQHVVNFDNFTDLQISNPEKLDSLSICALGTTIKKAGSEDDFRKVDLEYACNFAEFSINQQCESFAVVSSIGANENSGNFYLKVKGMMERRISEMGFKSVWIFRPSLLIGKRAEFRLGEKFGGLVSKLLSPLIIGPLRKYRPIEMSTVALALSGLTNQRTGDQQVGVHALEGCQIEALAIKNKKKLKQI